MNKLEFASAIGGILCAVTWMASYDAFHTASYMLYGNTYIIPLVTTVTIMAVYIGCLLSMKYTEYFATCVIRMIERDLKK